MCSCKNQRKSLKPIEKVEMFKEVNKTIVRYKSVLIDKPVKVLTKKLQLN